MTKDSQEGWEWMMEYCTINGLSPARCWKEAEKAYKMHLSEQAEKWHDNKLALMKTTKMVKELQWVHKPTESGDYWFFKNGNAAVRIIRVWNTSPGKYFTNEDGGCSIDDPEYNEGYWCGPIKPPPLPQKYENVYDALLTESEMAAELTGMKMLLSKYEEALRSIHSGGCDPIKIAVDVLSLKRKGIK